MDLGLNRYFGTKRSTPTTRRVTFAKYPDGHEVRIEPARGCGRSMWTYDRGAAVGPGKALAIEQAIREGATIEVRIVSSR